MITGNCPICGKPALNLIKAIWLHLCPIDLDARNFTTAKGTFKMFGLKAVLCNFSPLLNTIIHWKYRFHELQFPSENGKQ